MKGAMYPFHLSKGGISLRGIRYLRYCREFDEISMHRRKAP
jgi:hypothetical protein